MPVVRKQVNIRKGPFENVQLEIVKKETCVLLVDKSSEAICGIHETEKQAERASGAVAYNLERGKMSESLLKKVPAYIHRKKKFNKSSKPKKTV